MSAPYQIPEPLLHALASTAGFLASACQECRNVYSIKSALGMPGGISHGLCRDCAQVAKGTDEELAIAAGARFPNCGCSKKPVDKGVDGAR